MKVHILTSKNNNNRLSNIVADKLKNEREHEFVYFDDPSALAYEKSLTIMDTVKGLDDVRIYSDFRHMGSSKLSGLATRRLLDIAKKMENE